MLTVPVMVAATIGFGGAGGLSSLASGPSQDAIGEVSARPVADRKLDSLTATTISLPTRDSVATNGEGVGSPGATLVGSAGGGTAPVDSGSSGQSIASSGGGTSSSSGGSAITTPTVQPPATNNVVGIDVNNLGGGGSGNQQGLINQLLQGLNPNH